MPDCMTTISAQRLITIRDKMLDALEKLSSEGISSYTIGDQTYTLRDLDDLIEGIEKLDRRIAVLTRTMGGAGSNRIDLRRFRS